MIAELFQRKFNKDPEFIINSPGRINFIGEHTDYNGGLVLPMAINLQLQAALCSRRDTRISVYSKNLETTVSLDMDQLSKEVISQLAGFDRYIAACALLVRHRFDGQHGYDMVLSSDIPLGAGLSSSAALILSQLSALFAVNKISVSQSEMPKLAQAVENEYIGLTCGIMDPLAIAMGKKGHALLNDCKTNQFSYIAIPESLRLVVVDTKTRRELTNSAYNKRHHECKQAATELGVEWLSDLTLDDLESQKSKLSNKVLYRRALHVVKENERVRQCVAFLEAGDLKGVGRMIDESHNSLRDLFEVSSDVLNDTVNQLRENEYCLGARLMGAGFAGCVLALTEGTGTYLSPLPQFVVQASEGLMRDR